MIVLQFIVEIGLKKTSKTQGYLDNQISVRNMLSFLKAQLSYSIHCKITAGDNSPVYSRITFDGK